MNSDEVSFDRVQEYSVGENRISINSPNMKGFICIPGTDDDGGGFVANALVTVTVIDPSGITFDMEIKPRVSAVAPNDFRLGSTTGIGYLEENSIVGTAAPNQTFTFYPFQIISAYSSYLNGFATNSRIYTLT
jgi:hypothetical protein